MTPTPSERTYKPDTRVPEPLEHSPERRYQYPAVAKSFRGKYRRHMGLKQIEKAIRGASVEELEETHQHISALFENEGEATSADHESGKLHLRKVLDLYSKALQGVSKVTGSEGLPESASPTH